jgi:transcriptional regulator with PAS, ATPase and Fis domain
VTGLAEVFLERLVVAGDELRGCSTAEGVLDAAPRLACALLAPEAIAALTLRARDATVVSSHGSAAPLPRDVAEAAARRAADAGDGARGHVLFDVERGGVAVVPLGSSDERWALAVLLRAGPRPRASIHALAVLAGLVDACLGHRPARRARSAAKPRARITFDDLIGDHPAFLVCVEKARRAALSDVPLLITGETGTGKEMMAQAIHNASMRHAEPYMGINVAAIPRELVESELFGYERGAFTGARTAGKPGSFEVADGGTLLLDEIGDMPLDLQVKLLRVLQERTFVRVGGTHDVPLRARLIATTHKNLRHAADMGSFRSDLYYRLRGVHLHVPPLRERRSDIPLLVDACLRRYAERTGRPRCEVSPRALQAYVEHDWRGNVRELVHMVEAEASILPPGDTVIRRVPTMFLRFDLPPDSAIPSSAPPSTGAPPVSALVPRESELTTIQEVERREYERALLHAGGNVSKAARALGVSRGTLYNNMRRYGLAAREEKG